MGRESSIHLDMDEDDWPRSFVSSLHSKTSLLYFPITKRPSQVIFFKTEKKPVLKYKCIYPLIHSTNIYDVPPVCQEKVLSLRYNFNPQRVYILSWNMDNKQAKTNTSPVVRNSDRLFKKRSEEGNWRVIGERHLIQGDHGSPGEVTFWL